MPKLLLVCLFFYIPTSARAAIIEQTNRAARVSSCATGKSGKMSFDSEAGVGL